MSTLRLTVLMSLLQPRENLDARYKNWFSDGYRASAPFTQLCVTGSDCEYNERCQGGLCVPLYGFQEIEEEKEHHLHKFN